MSEEQNSFEPDVNKLYQRINQLESLLADFQRQLIASHDELDILHTLIDSMPDYIYIKDSLGRHTLVNQTDAELKGKTSPKEVIGKTDFDFFPADIAASFFNDEQEIIRTGKPLIDREERIIDQRTKREKWLSSTKVPWISNGVIRGIIGVGRDITEKKAVRTTTTELARISTRGEQSILDITVDQAVMLLNARNGGLYQYYPEQKLLKLVASKDRPNDLLGYALEEDEGIAGYLIQTGKHYHVVPDYNAWSGKIERHAKTHTLGSVLAVLLVVNDVKIGVLYVNDYPNRHYAQHDIDILELFAEQAAVAIQSSQLYTEIRRKDILLTALDRLNFEIISRDYQNMADAIVDTAITILDGDGGKVYLLDETGENLRLMAVRGKLQKIFKPGSTLSIKEGIAGQLIRSGDAFAIENNYPNSPYRVERLVPFVSAVIEVPLIIGNRTIGVLGVFADRESRHFSEGHDTDSLTQFALQAAIILDNIKRYDIAQRRIRNLEILHEIVQAVAVSQDANGILEVIVKQISVKLECTHCTIFLAEENHGKTLLVPRKTYSTPEGYSVERVFQEDEGIAGLVFTTGEAMLLSDATKHPLFADSTHKIDKPRSMIATPIKVKGHAVGVLTADQDEEGWFSADDLDLLNAVAGHAAIAIAIEKAASTLSSQGKRDTVFISYSHKDIDWLQRILIHLSPLQKRGLLNVWLDRQQLRAGDLWMDKIENALRKTKMAILLVSPNFMNSDFIRDHELPPILEAAKKGELRVFWVVLSRCLYRQIALENYLCGHDPAKPLDTLPERELNDEIVSICEKIIALYEENE